MHPRLGKTFCKLAWNDTESQATEKSPEFFPKVHCKSVQDCIYPFLECIKISEKR